MDISNKLHPKNEKALIAELASIDHETLISHMIELSRHNQRQKVTLDRYKEKAEKTKIQVHQQGVETRYYSSCEDGEYWHFECWEEAADEWLQNETDVKIGDEFEVYGGDLAKPQASNFLPDIFGTIRDQAVDEFGEHAESYLNDMSDEQECVFNNIFSQLVDGFLIKNKLEPKFGWVQNIESIKCVVKSIDADGDAKVVLVD